MPSLYPQIHQGRCRPTRKGEPRAKRLRAVATAAFEPASTEQEPARLNHANGGVAFGGIAGAVVPFWRGGGVLRAQLVPEHPVRDNQSHDRSGSRCRRGSRPIALVGRDHKSTANRNGAIIVQPPPMTVELLIHGIVRQTTILIAQLATSQGLRAPLAQIANQVFVDLARELERQGVSRSVSANMFGLGLRTYRRKIQRLRESSTERGRSLWEIVLEYITQNGLVNRQQILFRFSGDDETQVKAVLHDLCESQLVFSSGTGSSMAYRAATAEESALLQRARGTEGEDELLVALIYRDGPLTSQEIATMVQIDCSRIEESIARLADAGRIERIDSGDEVRFRARALVIPLGAPAGWEGAVFDHFKAMVTTVLCRLRENRPSTLRDRVGGSTYTIDVWDGHPLQDEVFGALGQIRSLLGQVRKRVDDYNATREVPSAHSRVVVYVGQSVIQEDYEQND